MRTMIAALATLIWLFAGTAVYGAPPEIVILHNTTVGQVNGVRVGVGSIWDREYELPDKSHQYGLTAKLFPQTGEPIVVGDGSIVSIGGQQWRVSVSAARMGREGPRGSVRLTLVK